MFVVECDVLSWCLGGLLLISDVFLWVCEFEVVWLSGEVESLWVLLLLGEEVLKLFGVVCENEVLIVLVV